MSNLPENIERETDGRINFKTVKETDAWSHCEHPDFDAICQFDRVINEESGQLSYFICEVQCRCKACQVMFVFEGLPHGMSPREPMSSAFGLRARLPIHPFTDAVIEPTGSMTYNVECPMPPAVQIQHLSAALESIRQGRSGDWLQERDLLPRMYQQVPDDKLDRERWNNCRLVASKALGYREELTENGALVEKKVQE